MSKFKSKGSYLVYSFAPGWQLRRSRKEPLAEFSTLAAAKAFAEAASPHRLRWKKEEALYEGDLSFRTTYYSDDFFIEVKP